MALQGAVTRAATCSGCRQWVLRSFIASIGGLQVTPTINRAYSNRHFAIYAPRRNASRERLQQAERFALNEINDDFADAQEDAQQKGKRSLRREDEQPPDIGEEAVTPDAIEASAVQSNEVQAAMERLDIADTWEEVVSLWLEGRVEQAEQLLALLKEEIRPKRRKTISNDVKLVLRALRGEASEAIQRLEEMSGEETGVESTPIAHQDEGGGEVQSVGQTEETTETVEGTPWYLQPQHQLPRRETLSPRATRQQVPALPPHAPHILSQLLNYVSMDLGMDDLSLLDLRTLDPPPALGANLFMLVGTARSEKHLHVSADRFCRWLRSEHQLTPFADGLLGRNELKLKMKRKAKRSRLLSAVGAKNTADTELDEGIRTGWICVNIGRVEGGESPDTVDKYQHPDGFVGFGPRSGGSRVVVQLMTDEKRGEIDLEKLWTGILNRSKAEQERAAQDSEASSTSDILPFDVAAEARIHAP